MFFEPRAHEAHRVVTSFTVHELKFMENNRIELSLLHDARSNAPVLCLPSALSFVSVG